MKLDKRCAILWLVILMIIFDGRQASFSPDLIIPVNYGWGIAIDPISRALFVSEWTNNRILRFVSVDSLTSGAQPVAILGQPNMTSTSANAGGISAATLNMPTTLSFDTMGTLWVVDAYNHRVLRFKNAANLPTGALADGVVGQDDFVSSFALPSTLAFPAGLTVQGSTLWVSDQGNYRVLRYDGVTSGNFPSRGVMPNGVIGQPNMTSTSLRLSAADSFNRPYGVLKVPNGGLYVSDQNFERVLYFNEDQARLATGAKANVVYGKSTFTSPGLLNISSSTFYRPTGLAVGYEGTLFVADWLHNRILLFPPIPPTSNKIPANQVLGQPDFTTSSSGFLSQPHDIFYDEVANALWVADSNNNRVLRYSDILVRPTSTPDQTVEVAFLTNTPQVKIFPKDAVGQAYPGEKEFLLQPTLLEEIANGIPIASAMIPTSDWVINKTVDADGNQYFAFHTATPVNITIQYTLFAVASTINSAGISFSTLKDSLKFQVSLSGWNFSSSANILRVHLRLTILPVVTQALQFDSINSTSFVLYSGDVMTSSINLIRSCVVDSAINSPMTFALYGDNGEGGSLSNPFDLLLDLPYFNKSVLYDPDFSVTLSNEGGDGGGDDTELLPLLALIALVIPVTFIFLGTAFGVFVCVKKRNRMRAIDKAALGILD